MDCSPPGSSSHGDSPGKITGMGCHFLLQGIFLTQESNPGLPHCRQILYFLSRQGSIVLSLENTYTHTHTRTHTHAHTNKDLKLRSQSRKQNGALSCRLTPKNYRQGGTEEKQIEDNIKLTEIQLNQ